MREDIRLRDHRQVRVLVVPAAERPGVFDVEVKERSHRYITDVAAELGVGRSNRLPVAGAGSRIGNTSAGSGSLLWHRYLF